MHIPIPKNLDPIVQAFFAESPKAAKKLVEMASEAIYGSEYEKRTFDVDVKCKPITKEELEIICAFMQGIKPTDIIEAITAAQVVTCYMLGMRKMSTGHIEDQRLGLKMFRFVEDASYRLHKKRSGAIQHINIHYHGTKAEASSTAIPVQPLLEE